MSDDLTDAEQNALYESVFGYSGSQSVGKDNLHTFLRDIVKADDTTKVGFLEQDEIGSPKHPTRAYKTMSLIAKDIMDNPELSEYFQSKSEIITSTSLSKQGFLDKLAVLSRKELADVTQKQKQNKGWFGRKKDKEEQPVY